MTDLCALIIKQEVISFLFGLSKDHMCNFRFNVCCAFEVTNLLFYSLSCEILKMIIFFCRCKFHQEEDT